MDKNKISQALTIGLLTGYDGKTKFSPVIRGSFELNSSHYENDGIIYHDEWNNGGGQEIIKVGNELFTRVYAGGMVNQDILKQLNISPDDIIKNLVSRIQELKDKTRLFDNCQPDDLDDWGYEYKITDKDETVSITTGKEIISFKNQVVFVHIFVLSPVEG